MLYSVQALRALAAWAVVFCHFAQINMGKKGLDLFLSVFWAYGAYGVDLFFIISGFVLFHSTRRHETKPATFLWYRVRRIVPAYWLATSVLALLVLISPRLASWTAVDLGFFIKSLLFIPAQNPSGIGPYPLLTVGWSLNYEMMFYAIFSVVLFLPRATHVVALGIGLVLLQLGLSNLGGVAAFYARPIMYEFLLGVLIAWAWQRGWFTRIHPLAAVCVCVAAVSTMVTKGKGHDFIWVGLPCAAVLIAAISQEKYFPRRGPLPLLGDWSYSTYLWHAVVLTILAYVSKVFGIRPNWMLWPAVPLVVLCSWLSFEFIEKRFGKGQGASRAPSQTSAANANAGEVGALREPSPN